MESLDYASAKGHLIYQNGYLLAHGGSNANSVLSQTRLFDTRNPERGWIPAGDFGFFDVLPRAAAAAVVTPRHWFLLGGTVTNANSAGSVPSYQVRRERAGGGVVAGWEQGGSRNGDGGRRWQVLLLANVALRTWQPRRPAVTWKGVWRVGHHSDMS